MPEPLHPPYESGAMTSPRQLVRWLDVNAQNGALTRTQTFITVPTFSVAYGWRGYSNIIATFNFEGLNNFSLKRLSAILPSSPNYYLCVSYRTGTTLVRYALWKNVGEILFFNPPVLYTGQMIKKNFRLEVWSTSQGSPVVNAAPFNIYTSVRGSVDYRYGTDSSLVSTDGLVSEFRDIAVATAHRDLAISGTGTGVDDTYTITATVNGHPFYSSTTSSDHRVQWNGLFWIIEFQDGFGWHTAYESGENVTDPSYVVTWTSVTSPPPLPVVVGSSFTPQYLVPLTFPANSVSQSN